MTTINNYVCNLIAGNTQITTLYFAVDRARDIVNKDNKFQRFNKKISFQGIGTKVYSSSQLVNLENLSYCTTYTTILEQINTIPPTLDQYIILLLKGRNTIRGLYQACCRARILKEQAKLFCYTFVNPFGNLAGVTKNKLSFKGANDFLLFFCQCERNTFDPLLVFKGIYVPN
jgi:hypothetical protein